MRKQISEEKKRKTPEEIKTAHCRLCKHDEKTHTSQMIRHAVFLALLPFENANLASHNIFKIF